MSKNFISENLYQKIISLIPVSCVDLVIKKNNSFLLVKRLENPAKNQWWFPGGKVFLNEDLVHTVKRKLKEEVNITKFQKIEFLEVGELKFKKNRFNKPEHNIINVFLVKLDSKSSLNILLDSTSSEYKWFNRAQKNFHPHLKKFLKLAKSK